MSSSNNDLEAQGAPLLPPPAQHGHPSSVRASAWCMASFGTAALVAAILCWAGLAMDWTQLSKANRVLVVLVPAACGLGAYVYDMAVDRMAAAPPTATGQLTGHGVAACLLPITAFVACALRFAHALGTSSDQRLLYELAVLAMVTFGLTLAVVARVAVVWAGRFNGRDFQPIGNVLHKLTSVVVGTQ